MKMYINGQWVDRSETMPVVDPFKQTIIDTVPRASGADVELAITSAIRVGVLSETVGKCIGLRAVGIIPLPIAITVGPLATFIGKCITMLIA